MDNYNITPRKVTPKEVEQGYIVCPCAKFAHILSAKVLRRLPTDYIGELCPECNLWMCAIDKIDKEE